jgi:hypothetical protein
LANGKEYKQQFLLIYLPDPIPLGRDWAANSSCANGPVPEENIRAKDGHGFERPWMVKEIYMNSSKRKLDI